MSENLGVPYRRVNNFEDPEKSDLDEPPECSRTSHSYFKVSDDEAHDDDGDDDDDDDDDDGNSDEGSPRDEPVITTGEDVAYLVVDVRDDGGPALTFRSFFLGTLMAGLGATLNQV
jgi:hypothetical protein